MSSLDGLLEDCPVIDLDEQESLQESTLSRYSLLVLLSGQLELENGATDLPKSIVTGDYVGGLNPKSGFPGLSAYRAVEASQILAFDDDLLNSLLMVSHSAAVNLSALAMEQLKHITPANDARPAPAKAPPKINALPAPKLHDAEWLEELLDRQIIRSLTDQEPLSLAILEIDCAEEYRQKHGDESIEYVSNSVAHCILDNVRPGDMVARIDEEHFVVVLPRASVKDARRPAGRLSREIAQTEIVIPNDLTLPAVSVSIGICQLHAMVGSEKFVGEGIDALQRAKVNGPGSISD
jgi:diguanylate cyclase (GGDEF)-like protein